MNKTKEICYLGIGVALYVALAALIKIPLIGHIQTDLGYIVFGVYCVLFGHKGTIVGMIGCLIESLLFSGWVPIGWMFANMFIGFYVGTLFEKRKCNNFWKYAILTILAMFIGIGFIKTVIECSLYMIPFEVKFPKNMIAFVSDAIPMLVGLWLVQKLKENTSLLQ